MRCFLLIRLAWTRSCRDPESQLLEQVRGFSLSRHAIPRASRASSWNLQEPKSLLQSSKLTILVNSHLGITGVTSAAHCVGHGFDVVIFDAGTKEQLGGIWSVSFRLGWTKISIVRCLHASCFLCCPFFPLSVPVSMLTKNAESKRHVCLANSLYYVQVGAKINSC